MFRCRRREDVISLLGFLRWKRGAEAARGRTAVRGRKHAVARCEQSQSRSLFRSAVSVHAMGRFRPIRLPAVSLDG